MNDENEVVLAVLEGIHEDQRTLLVHVHAGASSSVQLRQQSWGEGVGWFTQGSIKLDTSQVSQLKSALGVSGLPTAAPVSRKVGGFVPRVVHADSA